MQSKGSVMVSVTRDMVSRVAQFSNIPLLFSLCRCVLEKLKAHMLGNTIAQRTGRPAHAVLLAPKCPLLCTATSESTPEMGPNLRVLFWGAFLIPYNLKRCFLSVLWVLQFLDCSCCFSPSCFGLLFYLVFWIVICVSMSVCLYVCIFSSPTDLRYVW